jgi:hypothetical protein
MFIFASSQSQRPRLNEPSFLVSRPLRSTPTPASRRFTATTSRSASERRNQYSVPSVSASARSLSQTRARTTLDRCIDARLLPFRARAADQDHAASTPGTTWPIHGHPPGSSRGKTQAPRFRCQLTYLSTPQQRTPTRMTRTSASGTSSWSPPDAITPRLLPGRSPRRSSANAAPGRFSACPRRPTLEGQQSSISCTAPPM